MQFQAVFSRLTALALLFVSFSMLVHAAPTLEARDVGTGCNAGCETGNQLVLTLTKAKAGVELNGGKIEEAVFNGTDPTQYVVAMTAVIQDTVVAVIKLEMDLTGTINSKTTETAALLAAIINTTVKGLYAASGKITLQVFLGLVQQTDAALKALIAAVVNLIAAAAVFAAAAVDAAKLIQIGLTYCANILGLN
ncbi:hypothetical protein FRC12_019378 [Ceratobasidium sp. 428]|nr:hypothetical protein FRC12_019378 [Ceratobasidium sp. 428]